MLAVVYKEKGKFALEERPRPRLEEPTDALVRVTLSSICTSDLHILHGSVPRAVPGIIVGHEMVGVVEETGPAVEKVHPGQRVAVNVETFCGDCFYCRRGFVNNCTDQRGGWALGCRIDGGQTLYVRVPFGDNGLTPIPEEVSDEQAIFTGDLLSTGYWGARIADIRPGDTVAVLGAGPTGACAMMCARLYNPGRIVAVDIDDRRLRLAVEQGWADEGINPAKQDPCAFLQACTHGRGADVVLEAAGGADTFQTAWQIARPNATVCVIALYDRPQSLPLPDMYGKNLTFKTGGVDACHTAEILELIRTGKIDATPLITHRYPLERAMEAYDLFAQKREGVIKVVLRP
ncbi:MAG TPA: alcohol dehydrogenase [Firmicutes bacterium]|nr:alcohol dehydrogenase [Bacillota bacterium]